MMSLPPVVLPLLRTDTSLGLAVLKTDARSTPQGRAARFLAIAEVQDARGQNGAATPAWDSLRVIIEQLLQGRSTDDGLHAFLALAYAGLGRRVDAIREAERAVALLPVASDALDGPNRALNLVEVLIRTREDDRAVAQIDYLLTIPSFLTPSLLRTDSLYAPLHGNPRFERLVARQ